MSELPAWFLRTFGFVHGLLWGSFLNVVIYRVPREMSVARPRSACPGCGTPIAAWDNIPVVSYLVLRGKARCCGAKLSPRYPLVELIGGVLSLAIVEVIVRQLPEDTTAVRGLAIYVADFGIAMSLVAAAFIDAEHMFLPDSITIGGAIVGLGTASLRDMTYADAAIGAAVGFIGVWLPFVILYKALRGRAGMGLGDAKLMALTGAWFGWPGVVFVFFAGAFQGTIAALAIYLVRGKIEEPESVIAERAELEKAAAEGDEEAKQLLEDDPIGKAPGEGLFAARMSFGPFLCLAILEYLFLGRIILERYFGMFL